MMVFKKIFIRNNHNSRIIRLLFPPSLPAIIYSVTAGINPLELFKQALIPAIFLMSIMFFYGLYMIPKNKKIEKFVF